MGCLEFSDRAIVEWATVRAFPWYYTEEKGLPGPCLKVHCGHVTAYFHRGKLRRLWAHADRPDLDDMFLELTHLMSFNARRRPRSGGTSLSESA